MGCFLACFGFSKKPKRRKPANKVLSPDQGHGSYKPLDSDVTTNLDITDNPSKSDSEFSIKGKERSILRIKKKVSFNLNIKAYEPLPNHDFTSYLSESEEEKCEENKQETAKASNDSEASKTSSYPSNYRYQNCRDPYDEDDDIKLEESDDDDIDDGDEEYDGDSDNSDNFKMCQEEFSEQFCSLSMDSEKRVTSVQLGDDKTNNLMPITASLDQELKKLGLNHKAARDRSQYVFSVLNPVENLTQWKAVKAKATPPLKQQRKENIELEQEQQRIPLCRKPIAVDASLSTWLDPSFPDSTNVGTAMYRKPNLLCRSGS